MSKLLIISDVAPTPKHTAGFILEQIISRLPSDCEIDVYNIMNDGLQTYDLSSFVTGTLRWARKPEENWSGLKYIRWLGDYFSSREAKQISNDIIRQVSRRKPDVILLAIQGQTMLRVATHLDFAGIEFSTIHWDPFSWWSHFNGLSKSMEQLNESVKKILRKSGTHIVPSVPYINYLKIDESNAVVMHIALNEFVESQKKKLETRNLCFSGQAYAEKELLFVFEYLNSINWKLNVVPITFHFYGNTAIGQEYPQVVHHGWLSPDKLVYELSKYHAGILPYPASKNFTEVSALSFPSKFGTYISANLPVIFIGAKSNPLIEDFSDATYFVENGNYSDMAQALLNIWLDSKDQSYLRKKIFEKYFSENSQVAAVRSWATKVGLVYRDGSVRRISNTLRVSRNENQFVYSNLSVRIRRRASLLSARIILRRGYRVMVKSKRIPGRFKSYFQAGLGICFYIIERVKLW